MSEQDNNMDWALKYLLPSEFGYTSLSEVYGCVFGEELEEDNWFIRNEFYNEKEEASGHIQKVLVGV